MRIVGFDHSDVEAAGRLLAARHAAERQGTPVLQQRFEESELAARRIGELLAQPGAGGVAAFRGQELAGYLIGRLDTDKLRERHIWVAYAGAAIAEGESAELYRDMYAAAAAEWVKRGAFRQYVLVPAGDAKAMDGWLRLGFGYEQVHGVQAIPTELETPQLAQGFEIRLARKEDEAAIRQAAVYIMEHQAREPVWGVAYAEDRKRFEDGYAALIDDDGGFLWVAVKDDELLGFQAFFPAEEVEPDMMMPGSCICLEVGATAPHARGLGVGKALTHHGLVHARQAGYVNCVTDWRITNLESSRFWPRRGFVPYAYRLFRQVDPRILWATGREG
jgi:GNAT superfamily N-acetyltransferase